MYQTHFTTGLFLCGGAFPSEQHMLSQVDVAMESHQAWLQVREIRRKIYLICVEHLTVYAFNSPVSNKMVSL